MSNQKKTESPITFRPLSDGLGFHPFSDGLPYAPVSKASTPKKMGTGAVAAGTPRIVLPTPQVRVDRIQPPKMPQRIVSPPNKPIIERQVQTSTSTEFGLGYLFSRLMASLLDAVTNGALVVGVLILFSHQNGFHAYEDLMLNTSVLMIASCFLFLVHWFLVTFQEVIFKTSLGKRVFGLKLNGSSLMILSRAFLFVPSFGLFGLGLLWALVDSKKRCLHDLLTHTQPIR